MHIDKFMEKAYNFQLPNFKLMDEVQMPKRLRDLSIPREAMRKMAEKLLGNRRLIQRNPKSLTIDDALKIIEGMW